MRKTRAAGLLASLALAAGLAACGSPGVGQALLPLCSSGHGSDGSTSALAIRQHGSAFTGTYLTSPAGDPNEALRYAVTGTASGGRLRSTWSVGNVVLRVTGRYTASTIVLDNPGGKFSTTVFRASSGCPG